MPWHLLQHAGEWCVVKDGASSPVPGGCHPTQGDAEAHLAALNAAEPAARAADAHGCTCSPTTVHTPATTVLPPARAAAVALAPAAELGLLERPFPVPLNPPGEWFTEPPEGFEPGRGITITPEGRFAAYWMEWGDLADACMIGQPGWPDECTKPTPSPTGYAAFHQQTVITAEGEELRVGAVPLKHASAFGTIADGRAHYNDPHWQRAIGRSYDNEHGGYVLGALVPTVDGAPITHGHVAELRRCAMSGDWRPFDEQWFRRNGITRAAAAAVDFYDNLGPVFVTRPGLPLVRAYRQTATDAPVLQGGIGGVDHVDGYPSPDSDREVPMEVQTIRLADGTALEVPDTATVVMREGTATVGFAPAAQAAPDGPPDGPPVAAGDGEIPEPVRLVLDDHETRLSAIEGLIEEAANEAAATARASVAELAAADVALPEGDAPAVQAAPHDFVDASGDGRCDVCGYPEDQHQLANPTGNRREPTKLQPPAKAQKRPGGSFNNPTGDRRTPANA